MQKSLAGSSGAHAALPAPAPAIIQPRAALAALDRLRARLHRVELAAGLTWIGLAVVGAAATSFALDYLLKLPVVVRAAFLVAAIAGCALAVVRRLLLPLRRSVSDDDLALLVEERNPELRQILITAVQLSRPGSFGARHSSASLLDSVVKEAEGKIGSLAIGQVVKVRPVARRLGALVLSVVALLTVAALAPDLAGIWLRRNILLGSLEWPRNTMIEVLPGAPYVVATGDDLAIFVRVLRGTPRAVTVESRAVGAGNQDDLSRSTQVSDRREGASCDVIVDDFGPEPERARDAVASAAIGGNELERVLEDGQGRLAVGLGPLEASDLRARLEEAGATVRVERLDVFPYRFEHVSSPLEFWIEADDDRVGPFRVDVVLRPRIDMQSIEVRYRLPEYTGLGGEEVVQRLGHLRVPVGAEVEYRMATNVEVSRAFFVLVEHADDAKDGGDGRRRALSAASWPAPGAVELPLDGGRGLRGSFVVRRSGYYSFQFESARGFRSVEPERFRIQAIEDRKPEVHVVEPTRLTEEVSPEAEVTVRVLVKDDHGVRRAAVQGTYFGPDGVERVPQSIDLSALAAASPVEARRRLDAASGKLETELRLRVADLRTESGGKPVPGARFEFYVVAEDFGSPPGPGPGSSPPVDGAAGAGQAALSPASGGNVGESQVYLLQIVDKELLTRLLTNQLMVIRDQLRELQGRQEAVRKDLEAYQREQLLAETLKPDQAAKVARHRQDQERIREGLIRQVGEVDRLLAQMDANAVGDEEWKTWLRGVRGEMDALARRTAGGVTEQLEALRRDVSGGPQPATRLAPITSGQRQVERELRTLVARLTDHGDVSMLIQLFRDIRDREASLRDRTREQVGPESGKATER